MWVWYPTTLLNKFRPVFTPLERRLIYSLQSKLQPDTAEVFIRQIEHINLVQRHSDGREVCCYTFKNGKRYNDPTLQFPVKALDLKFATIKFTMSDIRKQWTAEFHLVEGYFFSIVFNSSPKEIQKRADVQIQSVEIHHDPMRETPTLTTKPAKLDNLHLSGWLREWSQKYDLRNVLEPLKKEDRNWILNNIAACLPIDYLEMVEQCEGFTVDDITVLGLSEVFDITLPATSYYVLVELLGRGQIVVRAHSNDRIVYHNDYIEEDLVPMGTSFHEAVEMHMAHTD